MVNDFPQALTIAGSDSDGSSGMEADLRAFFQCHVYGLVIQTTAVAGNSFGVFDKFTLPVNFIESEFKNLAVDFKIKATKTGMLPNSEVISLVAKEYRRFNLGPLIVDPVIISKRGAFLMDESGIKKLREQLLPLATVLTPNFLEAQRLADFEIYNDNDVLKVAKILRGFGAKNIIIKGGHNFQSDQKLVRDLVLLESGDYFWLENRYVNTDRINGTGDTLSALITAEIAKRRDVKSAIIFANKNTYRALSNPIGVGHKFGPINHWKIKED